MTLTMAMKKTLGASVACWAMSASLAAQAQTLNGAAPAPAEAATGTQEIVVTAQFREQKLQDTPIAITAVTGEALEQRSATNLTDVAAQAPSVVLRTGTGGYGNAISASIRGFGQSDFNPAYEPGVGIYIDDVYYPRLTGANFDLLDVSRVEVLRGPQGTLTGKNSEGGAIRFVSRKPDGNGSGYFSGTYGSRNRLGLRGSADFTVAKDLYARVSGTYSSQEGYVDVIDYGCAVPSSGLAASSGGANCVKYKMGDVGYGAARAMLRYNPSSNLDVLISADYTKDKHNNPAEVLIYGNNANPNVQTANGLPFDSRFICGRFCNYAVNGNAAGTFTPLGIPLAATNGPQESDYDGWGVSGTIDFSFNDHIKLTSITAYRAWKSAFSADGDLSPANVSFGVNRLTDWFWSHETRLNIDLGNAVQATIGGYYSDEKTTYYSLQDIRSVALYPPVTPVIVPLVPLQFIQNDPVRTKSSAVFGTVIVKPFTSLTLTLGGRYTHDTKTYTFYRYNLDGRTINPFLDPVGSVYGSGYNGSDTLGLFGGGTVNALTGRSPRYSGSHFDYRASLDYRFSPAILAYGTISTGYKAGGVGPRPFNAAQARPFGPEKLTAFEIGLKTDLFDRKLRINLAGFYNDFKDAQLTLLSCPQFGGPGPCALPQNAGNAHVKGVEAEFSAMPLKGLEFDGSASYLKWHWTCVNPAVVGLASGACSSDSAVIALLNPRPLGVISAKWSLGAQYEAGLGNAGSLTMRFDASYQGRMPGGVLVPAAGSPSALYGNVAAYTLANARLTWRNPEKTLSIALEATNLFDKYYYPSVFDLTGGGAGTISAAVGRPREWAVTVRKEF